MARKKNFADGGVIQRVRPGSVFGQYDQKQAQAMDDNSAPAPAITVSTPSSSFSVTKPSPKDKAKRDALLARALAERVQASQAPQDEKASYSKGGKVKKSSNTRGYGCATKGTKKARMY